MERLYGIFPLNFRCRLLESRSVHDREAAALIARHLALGADSRERPFEAPAGVLFLHSDYVTDLIFVQEKLTRHELLLLTLFQM